MRLKTLTTLLIVYLASYDLARAQSSKANIYGDMDLVIGKSTLPTYPRGAGPDQHWRSYFNFNIEKGRLSAHLQGGLIGGALIDNPDQFNFKGRLDYFLHSDFSVFLEHQDQYSLNKSPVADPAARTPGSSVNSTWLGFDYSPIKNSAHQLDVLAKLTIRSDEPLYFRHYTKPYATKSLGIEDDYKRFGFNFHGSSFLYFDSNLGHSRIDLEGRIEKKVLGCMFVGLRGEYDANINSPNGLRSYYPDGPYIKNDNGRALFFTLRIPFGDKFKN